MLVDIVFAAGLARGDEDRVSGRVAGGDQADFAGHMIAGGDDDPLARLGFGNADTVALIVLVIELDIVLNGRAEAVEAGIVGAPLRVGEPVEERAVVGGP